MGLISGLSKTTYKFGKILRDLNALSSGDPAKIVKRIMRKRAGSISAKGLGSVFHEGGQKK